MTSRTSTTPATVAPTVAATALVGVAWASGHAWLAPGWTEGILSCAAMLAGAATFAAAVRRLAEGRPGRLRHDPASLRKAWGGRFLPDGRAKVPSGLSDMVPQGCVGPTDATLGGFDPCLREAVDLCHQEAVDLCHDVLARRLGPLAGPPSTWPAHARQVAAVILAHRGNRARPAALALARDITALHRDGTARHDAGVASRVDATLGTQSKELARHMERHAHLSTVLMSALQATRQECGVVATDLFGWLAEVDAPLWHALDAVGRRSCALEGAAAAHHRAMERRESRAMPRPALEGLARRIVNLSVKASAEAKAGVRRV